MPEAPATLADLVDVLSGVAPDLPVVFATDTGVIGAGYHVTELMLADIRSIDCAGRRQHWPEARIQVLDTPGGRAMAAGKLAKILAQGVAAIPGLGDAVLKIECAPGNRGLSTYLPGPPVIADDRLTLLLIDANAVCKPLQMAQSPTTTRTGCCA